MLQCNNCGKSVPENEGVNRSMKTGSYSNGQDYFREVLLCPRCDADQNVISKLKRINKTILFYGAVIILLVGCAILFFR